MTLVDSLQLEEDPESIVFLNTRPPMTLIRTTFGTERIVRTVSEFEGVNKITTDMIFMVTVVLEQTVVIS